MSLCRVMEVDFYKRSNSMKVAGADHWQPITLTSWRNEERSCGSDRHGVPFFNDVNCTIEVWLGSVFLLLSSSCVLFSPCHPECTCLFHDPFPLFVLLVLDSGSVVMERLGEQFFDPRLWPECRG